MFVFLEYRCQIGIVKYDVLPQRTNVLLNWKY